MKTPSSGIMMSFSSVYGRFKISNDEKSSDIYKLEVKEHGKESVILNRFCSINDAILAVANQETGFLKWDGLCFQNIPHRVHDIACWEFENFSGTKPQELCS